MGADPLAALRARGDTIFHVHAKNTPVEAFPAATNGLLETRANDRITERAWNFAILGYRHSKRWWAEFVADLRLAALIVVRQISALLRTPPWDGVYCVVSGWLPHFTSRLCAPSF